MEWGGLAGELPALARGQLQTQREETDLTSPTDSSANEKPPHLERPVSSDGLSVHNHLPNRSLFSLKKRTSPLFPRLAYSLTTAYCPGL